MDQYAITKLFGASLLCTILKIFSSNNGDDDDGITSTNCLICYINSSFLSTEFEYLLIKFCCSCPTKSVFL